MNQQLLLEFINTLDSSLKRFQEEIGSTMGVSKLTISQLQYIDAIGHLGQPTITEVADQLKITKASVTAAINKLIDLGYVVKRQSAEDKRVWHVSLTPAGEKLIAAKHLTLQEYGAFIQSALSGEEVQQFEAILAKLIKVFKGE